MLLDIHLKTGKVVQVSDFKEIRVPYLEQIVTDVSTFMLNGKLTYVFVGKSQVIVQGDEIQYLEIT